MYRDFTKPLLDFISAVLLFCILFPVFLIVAAVLIISNGGSPFFVQRRPGKDEKMFSIIKFKTMNDRKDAAGKLLPDGQRLTVIGNFIRKTSLDEIPQLLNVIQFDMSFVGPRPLLSEYLPLYNDQQKNRHLVKPGITGWAQVNGRNAISWEKKFELDTFYIGKQSFLFDLRILFITLKKVFRVDGISQQDHATVEVFKGNQ